MLVGSRLQIHRLPASHVPLPSSLPKSPCPPCYKLRCVAHRLPASGEQQQGLCYSSQGVSCEGLPCSSLGYLYPSVEHRDGIVPVRPPSASNRFQLVPVSQHKALCCSTASETHRQKQRPHFPGSTATFFTKLHVCCRFSERGTPYFKDRWWHC